VGFKCFTTLTTLQSLPGVGKPVQLFTYLSVREDALDLYGFATTAELDCFKLLISVNGVGPKAALAILSELSADRLAVCIAGGDAKSLTRAPGIGKKIAERIVLELKDHGFTDGKVHIAHCDNPEAAKRLKLMIHAVFAGAQVDVAECGGLCSYYAEQGGLMVGYEDGKTE
jgi:Holliday junction DNA helicase RuvA